MLDRRRFRRIAGKPALRTLINRVRSIVGVRPVRPTVETEQRVGDRLVLPA